jgi:hypothetical protein
MTRSATKSDLGRRTVFGALLFAALGLSALAGNASAALITPHAATPTTVTPQVVTPPPTQSSTQPAPEPTYQPAPSTGEPTGVAPASSTSPSPPSATAHVDPNSVARRSGEFPRPEQDPNSSDCENACQGAWFHWAAVEGLHDYETLMAFDDLLSAGSGVDVGAYFQEIERFVQVKTIFTQSLNYGLDHEAENVIAAALNIAHPWGPDPSAGSSSGTGSSSSSATNPSAGEGHTDNSVEGNQGPAKEQCRGQGNASDTNEQVEDGGSGTNGCR